MATRHEEKLERMGRQLDLTEKALETHPLTHETLCVMQPLFHCLSLQTRWSLAGPIARLIMTEQIALVGHEKEKSASGFTGPYLDKLQKAVGRLIAAVLPPENRNSDLLLTSTQVLTLIVVYLTTQILGDSKDLFPRGDPAEAAKGGQFYQELGLIFLLSSKAIESAFHMVTRGLELEEPIQKQISDIGLFYMLIVLIALTDADESKNEELMETLQKYMAPPLNSIEKALQKAASKGILDEELAIRASGQLQLIRLSLDKGEPEAIVQAIQSGLEALEVPFEEIKKDVKQVAQFCAQFNQSLMGIFNQTEQAMTTMTQSA